MTESTAGSSTAFGGRTDDARPKAPFTAPQGRPGQARPVQGAARTAGVRQGPPRPGAGTGLGGVRAPQGAVRDGTQPLIRKGPRKARLTLSRLDPWSVLKLSFLLAVALGIISVVMIAVVWNVVNGMGVFTEINTLVRQVEGSESTFDLYDFVGFERMLSLATVIAVANVVVLTALATIFAFLYNIGSGLVGGLRVTLTDE